MDGVVPFCEEKKKRICIKIYFTFSIFEYRERKNMILHLVVCDFDEDAVESSQLVSFAIDREFF